MKDQQTGRLGYLALLVAAASCLPLVGSRNEDPYFSEWKRIESVREVAESLRYELGAYPSDLAAICTGAAQWDGLCDSGGDVPIRDRWGHGIWYEPSAASYHIGSVGPDGVRGSPDDLEIDTSLERERVSGLAGCYLIAPTDEHNHQKRLFVLDTARIDFLSSERKAWAPSPDLFHRPKWHPWRHDSLVVTWARVGEVVDIRLLPGPDTLRGTVHSPTDFTTWWNHVIPFEVVAVRIECDGH